MPRKRKLRHPPSKFEPGFIARLDKRTEVARMLRQNFEQIIEDVGGSDSVGHVKRALVERFVWLEAILRQIENDIATNRCDRTDTIGKWVQAVNCLTGLATRLGVDVAPAPEVDLQDYIQTKATTKTGRRRRTRQTEADL